MADQVGSRFGALDRRLAAAVRYTIDTAVTRTALAPMNAVHLRMTLIAEILDSEILLEPPSHRWYEFMAECFGRNSIGLQNSAVSLGDFRADVGALVHTDFAESYVTNETEDRIIQDLLVAAGTFLVAESTVMDEQIEQWNIAGRDDFVSEELCSIVGRAGAVGFNLLEHAEARTWRVLLSATTCEPDPAITDAEQTRALSAPAADLPGGSSETENPDYVTLMVGPVEASHLQALTARALSELREAANSYSESSRKDSVVVEVVSATDGSRRASLPLSFQRLDKRSIEHRLDQVAQLVKVLSQPADEATPIKRPLSEKTDLITGIRSATRTLDLVRLIILSSDYNSISPLGLSSKPGPGSSPKELVETLRDHDRLPDLRGVSVIFVCPAPSPETHLDACLPAICTAAGALSCKFHFSSPERGSVSASPAGGSFRGEKVSAAPPVPPPPFSGSSTIESLELPVRAERGSPAIGVSGVHLCDEDPVDVPVDAKQGDPPKRVVSVVDPSPGVGGPLSCILRSISAGLSTTWSTLADNRRIWRVLIQGISTAVIATVVMVVISAVRAMTDSILLVVPGVVLFALVCVLIGVGLNVRVADRKWRHVAELKYDYLNARETAMEREGLLLRGDYGSYTPENHQRTPSGP